MTSSESLSQATSVVRVRLLKRLINQDSVGQHSFRQNIHMTIRFAQVYPALPHKWTPPTPDTTAGPAEHFVAFLQRFVNWLRTRLAVDRVVSDTPTSFLTSLQQVRRLRKLGRHPCWLRASAAVQLAPLVVPVR
jgi:hypothetical protein